MQKVWLVWQTVDFNQDWLMGVFSSQDKADAVKADLFADWLADRDMTAAQFADSDGDDPFDVTVADVK